MDMQSLLTLAIVVIFWAFVTGSIPVFAKSAKISQDKYDECIYLPMTPEQKQALQEHIQAIAK
ncbi:hypothetical protein, partial [Nostoc favosum]